jgi:hypothetical protein
LVEQGRKMPETSNGNETSVVEAFEKEELLSKATINELSTNTVQSRARGNQGAQLMFYMAQAGGLLSPWWSTQRDSELRKTWQECDYFSGAMYSISGKLGSVPFRVEPRDPSIRAHWRQSEKFEISLAEMSEFGDGWLTLWNKALNDLWTQDNGMFIEIIGPGNKSKPIIGAALGLAHLDASRCKRTGIAEYPVLYEDIDGKKYRLHHTRVAHFSQLTSPNADMNGVGFCWLSRCLNVAQGMSDILRYKLEKLGSRPTRAILYGSGVAESVLAEAVAIAKTQGDNAERKRFAMMPAVVNPSSGATVDLNILDLASLPDGFDYKTDITLGMYTIALTGGFPPRWLWPATVSGATHADALYQHIAGATSGAGQTLAAISMMIGGSTRGQRHMAGKFLPPHLRFVFDFQDDELDRMRAEIRDLRSQRHDRDLTSGAVTVRVVREQMLSDGDITEAQFQDMELEDGRTPDGLHVLDMFYQEGNMLLEGIDPEKPDIDLVVERMHEAKALFTAATASVAKFQARMAVAALEALLLWHDVEVVGVEKDPADELVENLTDEDGEEDDDGEDRPNSESDEDRDEEEDDAEKAIGDAMQAYSRGEIDAGKLSSIAFEAATEEYANKEQV